MGGRETVEPHSEALSYVMNHDGKGGLGYKGR